MLSNECSPPDGDLPCPPTLLSPPLLKNSSRGATDDDDRAALQEKTDPFFDSDSRPRFSIRDHVYSVRSKDIKTSWPFSEKSLQVCLKHGVLHPLPPFQPTSSVKSAHFSTVQGISHLHQKVQAHNLDRLKQPISDQVSVGSRRNPEPSCNPTTAIQSQSEVEESPSVPYTEIEAPALSPTTPHKGKKCRLILKLGSSSSDPNTAAEEDITTLPEAMASKVCPVCKTFTSSSNTTLNAHIDQCLSVGSAPKGVPESNLQRHRIRPRKIRLMDDICATAPHSTLEELDRRNGTNWVAADNSIPPVHDPKAVVCNREKRQRTLPVQPLDSGDNNAGAVYVDSSGTKLRILSKFKDVHSELRVGENPQLGKSSKKNLIHRKRIDLQKHHKYFKLHPDGKPSGSLNACKFKIHIAQEQNSEHKDNQQTKQHQPQRTGLPKKTGDKGMQQLPRCKLHVARDFPDESNQSLHRNSNANGSYVQKSSSFSEKPILSPGSNQRLENSRIKSYRKHSPLSGEENRCGKGNFPVYNSSNPKLEKLILANDKMIELMGCQFQSSENSSLSNKSSSRNCLGTSSDAGRISGWRHKPLSITPGSKSKINGSCMADKKHQVQFTEDKEVAAEPSDSDQSYDLMCGYYENQPSEAVRASLPAFNRPGKKQEREPDTLLRWGRPMMTLTSQSESECSDSSSKSFDVKSESPESLTRSPQFHVENACVSPSSTINMLSLTESLHPEYHKLTGPYDAQPCEAQRGGGESSFVYGNELFFAGDLGEHKAGHADSFSEVEPIPIPGPPGSYLPSPRGMSSDDLKGSSSMTTSRVPSSPDQKEQVDGASSATSTISNPSAARLNPGSLEISLAAGSPRLQDTVRSQFLGVEATSQDEDDSKINETLKDSTISTDCQQSQLLESLTMSMGFGEVPVTKLRPLGSSETGARLVSHENPDCRSPVLRLMGKNLMVVNRNDDPPTQYRPNCCQNTQLLTCSSFSPPGNIQNPVHNPLHHAVAAGQDMFRHDPYNATMECFDRESVKDIRSREGFIVSQMPPDHDKSKVDGSMFSLAGSFFHGSSQRPSTGPFGWGCTPGSSVVLQGNPFMASPMRGPLKSPALYGSPNLS